MDIETTGALAAAQAGMTALARGEAALARELLQQAISAGGARASVWLGLAQALRVLGDRPQSGAAIDRALSVEPRNLHALVAKADFHSEAGDLRSATAFYAAALQHMPQFRELPADQQELLRRAKDASDRLTRELEDFVRAQLASAGFDGKRVSPRFEDSLDILLARKRPYFQEPRYFFFPGLAPIEYFPREMFPWLDAVEAGTGDCRRELEAAIVEIGEFAPYLTADPNRPARRQRGLLGNPAWGAYFLKKDGDDAPGASRCPLTLALLASAPLTEIPGRAPSVLFSKLAAGAHIPPHTGMLNVRLICHLPLIVPEGCALRVGNSVRNWVEGKAWVFDDTIEHEAWNKSGEDRYVLIFDVWRPELTAVERQAISVLCQAIGEFGDAGAFGV
jgi:aspartate beta-hydroxylase